MNDRSSKHSKEGGHVIYAGFFCYDFFFVNERQELKALERGWAHHLRWLRGACRQNQGLHAAGLEDSRILKNSVLRALGRVPEERALGRVPVEP